MSTTVENFELVLDAHRWVPLPAVGYPANSVGEESQEDVTPSSYLMEHPTLAVFVNGVSAAMNESRPCAPLSLKHVLAQELIKGLQAVSDSLLSTCFGRCYPGGAALIMDAKSLYGGIGRLLTHSTSRGLPKPADNAEGKSITENGDLPVVEIGVTSAVEETEGSNEDKKEQQSPTKQAGEKS